MANFHKISTVILLVLIGTMGGYFLSTTQAEFGARTITKNVTESTPQEISTSNVTDNSIKEIEEPNNITKEIIDKVTMQNPPETPEEYQSFIRPLEAEPFLDKINFTGENDTWGNYRPLDAREEFWEILDFLDELIFWKDSRLYGIENYWATPNESLNKMKGDDEDWAIALVSLMHAKNESYKCYIVGNDEFNGGVICYLGNNKQFNRFGNAYFDDWGTNAGTMWRDWVSVGKEEISQEKRIQLRKFRNDFLESTIGYCCINSLRNKRITFAFNEKEYFEFEGGEDVIDWLEGFMI